MEVGADGGGLPEAFSIQDCSTIHETVTLGIWTLQHKMPRRVPAPQKYGMASTLPQTSSTPLVPIPEADTAPHGLSPYPPAHLSEESELITHGSLQANR